MFIRHILSVCLFALFASNSLAAGFYSGSCSSQGEWVSAALEQAETIKNAIESLKNDPNCAGIETVVSSMDKATDVTKGNKSNFLQSLMQLNREIKDLRMLHAEGNGEFKQKVMDVLMGQVIDEADASSKSGQTSKEQKQVEMVSNSVVSLSERAAVTLDATITGLNETMKVLPNMRSCFNKRPNQALAIVSGIVRMGGTLVDGGEGVTSRFGSFLANVVTFMRNDDYAKILSKVNEKEFWASMSCLIETSSQAYCSAKDAYILLEEQKIVRKEVRKGNKTTNADLMSGYYLLVREIPRVSEWLQRVLIGLPPQMNAQAEFQKSVIDIQANLTKDRLSLIAKYSESFQTYQETLGRSNSPQDMQSKKSFVFNLIMELTNIMYRSNGTINFFEITVPSNIAPFFLLGVDMPQELRDGTSNLSGPKWIQNNMNDYAPFNDPDQTMIRLKQNMDDLINSVMLTGTSYFTTWFIPDVTKVVDDALVADYPNIFQSFENLYAYLDLVIDRYQNGRADRKRELEQKMDQIHRDNYLSEEERKNKLDAINQVLDFYTNPNVLPSIFDTQNRILSVIKAFNKRAHYFNTKDNYVLKLRDARPDQDLLGLNEYMNTELKNIDQKILQTAFDEFNVMLQRDTFLFNRFYNYVLSEYMDGVQTNRGQGDYMRDLLSITGRNLIGKLTSINRLNPNATSLDLAQAHPINLENLEALEQLLADNLKEAICKITARIGGTEEENAACGLPNNSKCTKKTRSGTCARTMKEIWGGTGFKSGSDIKDYAKGDDEFGSFNQMKAKYCIQALAFPTRWIEFAEMCSTAELISQFSDEAEMDEVKVNMAFADFLQDQKSKSATGDRICAFRDYMRKNQVYWLLNKKTY